MCSKLGMAALTKNEIAEVLEEIGVLLELKGENPFKVRAYGAGARVVESLTQEELDRLVAADELATVKGIGAALAQKIGELHGTGGLVFLDKLRTSIAPGLVEMLEVPGLGPKKIKLVHDKLGVTTMAELAAACTDGRVAELPGMGEKSQEKILAGIKNREAYGRRHLWWEAQAVAAPIVEGLRALPQVKRAEAAGSLRRGLETVGDLDFLVAAEDVAPVVEWFTGLPEVAEVTARGETKVSVRFASGIQADLRLVPEEQFAFALHHFTGSKDHNVQMRQRALTRGLSLSEWGLVPAEGEGTAKDKARAGAVKRIRDEAELFAALDLAYIPPALREGRDEIARAEQGPLPDLVATADLCGAFHNHTDASDGRNTLSEMVAAAAELGWDYLGIADHSKASFQANGLSEERLRGQVEAIAALNASGRYPVHVFAGVECDILPDGRLDYDDELLAELDYVVVSVHSAFNRGEAEMTARLIRAIEHPATTMLGHLTGRLLLQREGYAVDVAKIIDAAAANGVAIELNASPWRLDMDWRHWRRAADRGVWCVINPDAHRAEGLAHVATGVGCAQKAGLQAHEVLNTRPLAAMRTWLKQPRAERERPAAG